MSARRLARAGLEPSGACGGRGARREHGERSGRSQDPTQSIQSSSAGRTVTALPGAWRGCKILGVDRLSPDGVVEEFQERWRGSDLRDKMPEPLVVANGRVVELTLIAVPEPNQRKGYATQALQTLTALCDENGIAITLVARQMDQPSLSHYALDCPPTLSTDLLVAWYKWHGFVEIALPGDDTRTMERKPRTGDF